MQPLFSVIIPTWNGKHFLQECLSSLRGQTLKTFEALLVDNGSIDGTVEFVQDHFPEVQVIALAENIGFAAGVNAGIRKAAGAWIVLLNNDTAVEPDWLERMANAIQGNPEITFFASKLVNYFDRRVIDSTGDQLDLYLGPYKIGEGRLTNDFREQRIIFGPCGGGGCYKRELFEQIGLFDEDFFAYFEDVDLSFRANWAGYQCLSVPDAVIYHKVGGTSDASRSSRETFDIMRRRNFIFMVIKNYPAVFLLRYLPFIAASHTLKLLLNVVKGRFRVAFMTQWHILSGLPGMLAKHRSIMATRAIDNGEMRSRCVPKYGGWWKFLRHKARQTGIA